MTSNILKYLPPFLRTKIEHRPGLLKILDNISWLFLDKVLRMGVGLLVGVWVARYLGPEQFGLLNYAIAFVSLFGVLATLGLQEIIVRNLVKNPENAQNTISTGFVLRIAGGIIAFISILIVISYLRPEDKLAKSIVAIYGFTLIFKASEVVKYWFESQVQSKFVVWIENGIFVLVAALKVLMILLHATLIAFVFVAFAEVLLVSVLLMLLYYRNVGRLFSKHRHSFKQAKVLLKDSWPLILSGLAIAVYMKIDQIMLGQMLGDKAVGIYSAAVRISEIWYFIPVAIVSSVFPAIIEAKKIGKIQYLKILQRLFDVMIWLAIIVSITMTFLSNWLVNILYGADYKGAGYVLMIHIWSGVAVCYGIVWSKWILIENKQKFIITFHLLAVVLNIGYNIIFIPKQGEVGAAIATAFSYLTAQLIGILLYKREIALMFLFRSLLPIHYLKKK